MTRNTPQGGSNSDEAGSGKGPDGDGTYNAGMAVFSYMLGGIVVWSLVGWGLDNLFGTRWIVLVGALVGAGGGLYLSSLHNLTRRKDQGPADGEGPVDKDPQ